MLGISKDASDDEIKKSYRKLALQFHPDKCQAPGTEDAFKGTISPHCVAERGGGTEGVRERRRGRERGGRG